MSVVQPVDRESVYLKLGRFSTLRTGLRKVGSELTLAGRGRRDFHGGVRHRATTLRDVLDRRDDLIG